MSSECWSHAPCGWTHRCSLFIQNAFILTVFAHCTKSDSALPRDLSYTPAKREADQTNGTRDLRHTDRQTEALVCRCVSSKWQIKIISQVIWGQRDQALRSVCFGHLLVCIKCLIHLTGQPRTRGGFGFWTCVYVWASGVILCLSVCVCVFVCLWSLHAIC